MEREVSASHNEVKVSTWYPADVHQAFCAWTDPNQIEKWFGPKGFRAEVLEMDVRVDGQWRFMMISTSGKVSHHQGRYRAIEPDKFLSFTWESEEDRSLTEGQETIVSVLFEPKRGGVQVTLVHQKLPSSDSVQALHFGWSSGFEKMKNVLSSRIQNNRKVNDKHN